MTRGDALFLLRLIHNLTLSQRAFAFEKNEKDEQIFRLIHWISSTGNSVVTLREMIAGFLEHHPDMKSEVDNALERAVEDIERMHAYDLEKSARH